MPCGARRCASDGWFGQQRGDETLYQQANGSISPALLWDKFDGLQPRLRFDVDVPLPHMNTRLHAFVGRVNREEYVTERTPASGAFAAAVWPGGRRRNLVWHPLSLTQTRWQFRSGRGHPLSLAAGSVREGQLSLHARFLRAKRCTAFAKRPSGRTARGSASPAAWTSSGSSKTPGCCAGPDREPSPRKPKACAVTPRSP